ncbi:hypothetical protein SDC9_148135 [bioreactor metagenome]|uniref:Uncharacterized protein n=1 Tax=bioreactor metagenome TaxID=1076179 RepID=A0A645EGR0_9ZZZZ
MHQIGKLHRVLNEEHRNVVAHQIPVALVGIELDGKAAHVARRVHRARAARHRGKAHEDRHLHTRLRQHLGGGVFLE